MSEGIKNVRRLICDGNGMRLLIIHPDCNGGTNPPREGLIKSMATYSYDNGSAVAQVGEPRPLKVSDHHPDALRYGAEQLRQRRKE